MKVDEFIELYRNGGLTINRIGENHFNRQGLINYSFPNLERIPVDHNLIYALRWKYLISVVLTELPRKNSYEFILKTNDYSIERFAKKIRNRIRKSLQNCTFKRPSLEDLLTFGIAINQQTLERQHKKDTMLTDGKRWKCYITSFYNHENVHILGAYYANRMVGYIIATELEDKCIINHAFIDRVDSEITDPMNGLLYSLVNRFIETNGSVNISYGLDSIMELPELNRFKNNMLFDKVPVSRVYVVNPFLLPFMRLLIFYNIHLLKRKSIRSPMIRKMIRIYQGHRLYYRV
jgi:hypothetical protein